MSKDIKQSKKGFTIIEVVLVLAIAGLIFLMVFVALPTLQRSQRDTQRRSDMARFTTAINNYMASNNGSVPADAAGFNAMITNYLRVDGDSFQDPSGNNYTVAGGTNCTSAACNQASVATDSGSGNIRVYTNATCTGENPTYDAGTRNIAFTSKLEGSGIYCGHN